MQYENLNSLSKAYSSGDVDRSTYIRQRRQLIDAITHDVAAAAEDVAITSHDPKLDEQATIGRSATESASEKIEAESAPAQRRALLRKRLLMAAILVAVACGTFYLRTI